MIDVAIIMGSDSDWERGVKEAAQIIEDFGGAWEAKVLSAHRTPEELSYYIKICRAKVFICCAGMSAHLAGVVAAHTSRPVLGVPMPGGMMDGMDALLSTVQMPPGIPVATFGVGKAGARNAALFAVSILHIKDGLEYAPLNRYREIQREKILDKKVEL